MIERRTFSGRGIRYSATATTTAADDNNGDRGGTAPLAPSSATTSRETTTTKTAMTTMTTTTTTTIASPTMIESTRAAVLVPHLARRRFDVVVFTGLSCAVRKHVEARAFERHRCADVRASSSVKDGGMTALMALSLATAVATSTTVAAAPTMVTVMLTTSFVT